MGDHEGKSERAAVTAEGTQGDADACHRAR